MSTENDDHGAPSDHVGDLVVAVGEYLAQQEDGTLDRVRALEQDEKSER